MKQQILAWVASKGGWSHAVVILYCSVIALYAAVPAFAALCNTVYVAIPAWGHQILLAALGVAAFYKNTGVLATGNAPLPTAGATAAAGATAGAPSVTLPPGTKV